MNDLIDELRTAIHRDKGGPHAVRYRRLLDEIERLRKNAADLRDDARWYAENADYWRERCELIPDGINKAMK